MAETPVYGLQSIVETKTRQLFDIEASQYDPFRLAGGYIPIYTLTINKVSPGDILKFSGQVEVSEKNGRKTAINAYIILIRPDGNSVRVSPVATQHASRDSNHHMPLNLYGQYTAPLKGNYKAYLLTRAPNAEHINLDIDDKYYPLQQSGQAQNSVWVEYIGVDSHASSEQYRSDFGHLMIEHFKKFSSHAVAMEQNTQGVVAISSLKMPDTDIDILTPTPELIGQSDLLNLNSGDYVRIQSSAKAQYKSSDSLDINLFSLTLNLIQSGVVQRLSLSTENITKQLYRFSLQNNSFFQAGFWGDTIRFSQEAHGIHPASNAERTYSVKKNQGQLDVIHFSAALSKKLKTADHYLTLPTNISLKADNSIQTILSQSGINTGSDILRIQSQLQINLEAALAIKCKTRIEIWEDGSRRKTSVWDERFMRNDQLSDFNFTHASYSPFALYQLTSATYETKLVAQCTPIKSSYIPNSDDLILPRTGAGLFIEQYSL